MIITDISQDKQKNLVTFGDWLGIASYEGKRIFILKDIL